MGKVWTARYLSDLEIVDISEVPPASTYVPVPASWSLPPVVPDCQLLWDVEDMRAGRWCLLTCDWSLSLGKAFGFVLRRSYWMSRRGSDCQGWNKVQRLSLSPSRKLLMVLQIRCSRSWFPRRLLSLYVFVFSFCLCLEFLLCMPGCSWLFFTLYYLRVGWVPPHSQINPHEVLFFFMNVWT